MAFASSALRLSSAMTLSADINSVSAADRNAKVEQSSSDLVNEARRWIGTNPTGWDQLWWARFMNFVLKRTGQPESGSNAASSFASYGQQLPFPQGGAIPLL